VSQVFSNWRPVIGLVKPTMRPGSLEEFVRMLPDGVGVLPLHQHIEEGREDEFEAALEAYERAAAILAEQGVDFIHLSGTPPFMILGREGEKKLIARWKRKFAIETSAAPELDAAALRALGVTKLIGVTYSEFQNELSRDYMNEAGFDVLAMEPMKASFAGASHLSPHSVYAHIRKTFLAHPEADGIYIQGNAWRVLSVIEMVERDFGVPVAHANCALTWRIQKMFRINEPREGLGRLMRELP